MSEKLENYRTLLENISLARQVRDSLADGLIQDFCNRLEEQFDLLNQIREDRESAKAIHSKLEIISASINKKANDFYKNIPEEAPFKAFLVECHEESNLAYFNGQTARMCRAAFRQIETLVNYIVQKNDLYGWLADNPHQRKLFKINESATREEKAQELAKQLTLYNKIYSISFMSSKYFVNHPKTNRNLTNSFDKDKYYACYNLRNADSHGYNFNISLEEHEKKINEVESSLDDHVNELSTLIILLRDLVMNLYNG